MPTYKGGKRRKGGGDGPAGRKTAAREVKKNKWAVEAPAEMRFKEGDWVTAKVGGNPVVDQVAHANQTNGMVRLERYGSFHQDCLTPAAPIAATSNGPAPTTSSPNRGFVFKWRSEDGLRGILHIKNEGGEADYIYHRLQVDLFLLEKWETDRRTIYTIFLSEKVSTCGCDAGKNGKPCKHVLVLRALAASGRI